MRATPHTDFESEFHRLLGRLTRQHAVFDDNVGLQLSWLGSHAAIDVESALQPNVSFARRLHLLRKVVLSAFAPGGPQVLDEFKAWFKAAESSKALRNKYVHGRWGVPGRYRFTDSTTIADATPLLCFVPQHWDTSSSEPRATVELTLDEFAAQVDDAEAVLREWDTLVARYLHFVRPANQVNMGAASR